MKKQTKLNKNEYEQLGRMIENIYELAYMDRARMYRMSFVRGIVAGFGGVIGATVVVGLLLWMLSLLDYTPLKPLTEKIKDTVLTERQ